jgi:hypothetical protein
VQLHVFSEECAGYLSYPTLESRPRM